MNVLSKDKVLTVLGGLCEGQSIRSLERLTGVNRNTIMSWLLRAGEAAQHVLDEKIQGITTKYVQADEVWSFVGKNASSQGQTFGALNGFQGEAYIFIAIDAETKLVLSYRVGHRDMPTAYQLLADVRKRTVGTYQLTTDGWKSYQEAAELAFGADLHFGQLMKVYREDRVVGARPVVVAGTPDVAKISTSYVERNNLTLRMSVRRLTRKTSAFSKKAANHLAALHLYFAYYNFCRWHRTLKMTPAMAAGLTSHPWTMKELVGEALTKWRSN